MLWYAALRRFNYATAAAVIFLEMRARFELRDSVDALNHISGDWAATDWAATNSTGAGGAAGNMATTTTMVLIEESGLPEGQGTDLSRFFGGEFVCFFRAGQLTNYAYTLMGGKRDPLAALLVAWLSAASPPPLPPRDLFSLAHACTGRALEVIVS